MIKISLYLTLIMAFVSVCCFGQKENAYPVLVLDDKYSQIREKGSNTLPLNYQLHPVTGFILDCSKYDFSMIKKTNNDKNPDLVHIISRAGTFSVELNINGKTLVDGSTMKDIDRSTKKFKGFIKGDTVLLAIGGMNLNENGHQELTAYWLAMINIK